VNIREGGRREEERIDKEGENVAGSGNTNATAFQWE
jgi:hypothetical protein